MGSEMCIRDSSRTLVVPGNFLRVLHNNIHHHVAFAIELEEKEKNTEQDQAAVRNAVAAPTAPAAAAAEVRFSMTCRSVDGQGKRGNVHIPAIMSVAFPDVVVFDVSFSCGIVYSRGNRTPESEKKQTSVYLIKRKKKKKILYTYQVRIYPPLLCTRSRCANFMYFSSMHPVSTAAQSTNIIGLSQLSLIHI